MTGRLPSVCRKKRKIRQGPEYQIRVVEDTVTTDAKSREGEGFDDSVMMMLCVQCGIWKVPLRTQHEL